MRTVILSTLAVMLGLLAIGATAPMRELAFAPGVVTPDGELVELRHIDGGEVEQILVKPGEAVAAGQEIMRLRPLRAAAELRQLETRRAHLRLRADRLAALVQGATPRFVPDQALDDAAIDNERALYELERTALDAAIEAKLSRITQARLEARKHLGEAGDLERQLAAYGEQLAMLQELESRKAAARITVLELTASIAEVRAHHSAAIGAAHVSESTVGGLESEIAQLRATRASEWSREYSELTSSIAELDGEILRRADKLDRLVVRSPVNGAIQNLGAPAAGGAIAPGGVTAVIVPDSYRVLAEIRISPDDIGHVSVGDVARLRASTFDAETIGELFGVIETISPTSHESEKGERYYSAKVALDPSTEAGTGENEAALLSPGMVVEAQIQTGRKSVLRYLFKPVTRALERAFSER